jgi:hypothetical protein
MSSHLRLFNNQGEKIMRRTLNRESSNEKAENAWLWEEKHPRSVKA